MAGIPRERTVRACDLGYKEPECNNPEWKTVVWDELSKAPAVAQGSMDTVGDKRRARKDLGKWNLHEVDGETGKAIKPQLTFLNDSDAVIDVEYPYFGGRERDGFPNNAMASDVMVRRVPAKRVQLNGQDVYVATVFDLFGSYLGVDRGLGGECAKATRTIFPLTPATGKKLPA